MYGIFGLILWLARVFLALLAPYWRDLVVALAAVAVAGCTLVYVPARTTWTVQAGQGGTAATAETPSER